MKLLNLSNFNEAIDTLIELRQNFHKNDYNCNAQNNNESSRHNMNEVNFMNLHSPGCNSALVGKTFLMKFLCRFLLKKSPSKRIRMLPGEIRGHKLFKQFFLNNRLKIIFLLQKYYSRKIWLNTRKKPHIYCVLKSGCF